MKKWGTRCHSWTMSGSLRRFRRRVLCVALGRGMSASIPRRVGRSARSTSRATPYTYGAAMFEVDASYWHEDMRAGAIGGQR